jgi:cytochrome P450
MATATNENTRHASDYPRHPLGTLASTLNVMRAPRRTYASLRARQGDPFRVDTVNGRVLMTTSPEGAKQICAAPPETFAPFAVGAISALAGPGSLLVLDGERHKAERKLLRPPLHGARMKGYAEAMVGAARRVFGELAAGERFVAQDLFTTISLEVIARAIFGASDPGEVAEIMDAVDAVVGKLDPILMFNPRFHVAPFGLGPWAKFKAKRDRLDALLERSVERRRASGERGDDLLSMLLEARYEGGEPMSYEAIHDEIITMLVAGHETTSVVMTWALHHLHRNPDELARLRAALDAGPDDLPQRARIPYLKAVCDETHRLTPTLPDLVRVLVRPMELLGVEVPAGWCVGVAITTIHHDPEIFADPDAFRPQRFIDHTYSPFEFMPFGGGYRRCIGAALASFEMALVLDTVLSEFELELDEPGPVPDARRNVTMGPKTGVRMRMVGPRA